MNGSHESPLVAVLYGPLDFDLQTVVVYLDEAHPIRPQHLLDFLYDPGIQFTDLHHPEKIGGEIQAHLQSEIQVLALPDKPFCRNPLPFGLLLRNIPNNGKRGMMSYIWDRCRYGLNINDRPIQPD